MQPLAANVDVVLVCAGLHDDLPVRRIERLLTLAWDSGATPVLVLTKADLCADPAAAVRQAAVHAPGVDVVLAVGDAPATWRAWRRTPAPGTTLVLLGASGAGKSTLVNALAGRELMAVGDVRQVDGKGRHTTSHRELLVLPSGAVVIDTPGLRGVALQGSEEALAQAFSDVEDLAVACRFADCAHAGRARLRGARERRGGRPRGRAGRLVAPAAARDGVPAAAQGRPAAGGREGPVEGRPQVAARPRRPPLTWRPRVRG